MKTINTMESYQETCYVVVRNSVFDYERSDYRALVVFSTKQRAINYINNVINGLIKDGIKHEQYEYQIVKIKGIDNQNITEVNKLLREGVIKNAI